MATKPTTGAFDKYGFVVSVTLLVVAVVVGSFSLAVISWLLLWALASRRIKMLSE